ncbi:alpha/beta hydrolase fold-domain-containing protein [Aspergillus insuetus]
MRKRPTPSVDNAAARRAMIAERFSMVKALDYDSSCVTTRRYSLQLLGGHDLEIFGLHPPSCSASNSSPPGPTAAVLYLHGGGMTMGSALDSQPLLAWYASSAGLPLFSVEYRLAPEHPFPTPVEDCYAALQWLYDNAHDLNIDNSRIAVMGDSAGGGLAAAVALLARDRGEIPHPLAKQILIQPMLDDRGSSTASPVPQCVTWTWDDNVAGWTALLGSRAEPGSEHVPWYAVPARATDLRGLPPTYLEVGTLDIFREQVEEYASRLEAVGVNVDFQLYRGVPHAFHSILPETQRARDARQNHLRALQSF